MTKLRLTAVSACALMMTTFPALSGDPAAGEQAFGSQCANCHNVVNEEGDVLAGRPNMRTGPNLYGVLGRAAGSVEGFRYGASIVEVGENLEWAEEELVAYLQDPNTFLRETLDNRRARSQMSFRVQSEDTARDIVAFLATFSELEEEEEETGS